MLLSLELLSLFLSLSPAWPCLLGEEEGIGQDTDKLQTQPWRHLHQLISLPGM